MECEAEVKISGACIALANLRAWNTTTTTTTTTTTATTTTTTATERRNNERVDTAVGLETDNTQVSEAPAFA